MHARALPILSRFLLPLLVLALIGWLLHQGWSGHEVESIGGDASQNLRTAINLSQHGVYGEDRWQPIPGFRREPFPNWVLAFHLNRFVQPPAGITFQDFVADPALLRRATRVNHLYLLALFLCLWALCLRVVRPVSVGHVVSALVIYYSFDAFARTELDTLNTELPAALLIVAAGLGFVLVRQTLGTSWALLSGGVFGLLVLTKAVGAYIALLLIPLFPLLLGISRRRALRLGLCVALGFGLTVLPWVGRNLVEFGKPVVARGGGTVLLIRSVFNQMNPEEYRGAFYAYAPQKLKEELFEKRLGFSPTQLECGGSLQRLQRDLPCDANALAADRYGEVRGFYQTGKRVLPRSLDDQADSADSVEDLLRAAALERIRAAPDRHLLVSLPLFWRGIWSFENQRTWFGVLANAAAMLSLLLMPVLGLILSRPDWVLLSMVGTAYFLFYAFFSHFITRYSEPLIPLSLVCLGVLLVALIQLLARPPVLRQSNKVVSP